MLVTRPGCQVCGQIPRRVPHLQEDPLRDLPQPVGGCQGLPQGGRIRHGREQSGHRKAGTFRQIPFPQGGIFLNQKT